MVYRFKPSQKKHGIREKKPYRRAGADSPRRLYGYRVDAVDLSMLFELQKLEGAVKKRSFGIFFSKAKRIFRRVWTCISVLAIILGSGLGFIGRALWIALVWLRSRVLRWIEKRRAERKDKEVKDFHILTGALSAALVIAFLSAFAVLYKLILSDYFGHYEKVTVPDMVGKSYADAREMLDEKYYNITVNYEYSSTVPAGSVISQYPLGGAERKVFSGGSFPTLSIVVSRGKEMVEIRDLVGARARDAELELKNSEFFVVTVEDFSDSVPLGSVISTSPAAGEMLEVGGIVVLHVSSGKEKIMLNVPSLLGLTEAEATAKISASGFVVGDIDYKSSSARAGLVVSQDTEARTKLEKGSKISFSVSSGQSFERGTVPSLYGLTLEGAKQKLSEYGLVLGEVYASSSTEKKGTVIAQSPSAGSSISHTLVSVDVYVSS